MKDMEKRGRRIGKEEGKARKKNKYLRAETETEKIGK